MPVKEKRRLEVSLETHEITTISFNRGSTEPVFCQRCRAETLHLSVAEAALILEFPESAVYRLTETNQVHSKETAGKLRICGNSLSAIEQDRSNRPLDLLEGVKE